MSSLSAHDPYLDLENIQQHKGGLFVPACCMLGLLLQQKHSFQWSGSSNNGYSNYYFQIEGSAPALCLSVFCIWRFGERCLSLLVFPCANTHSMCVMDIPSVEGGTGCMRDALLPHGRWGQWEP